MSSVAVNLNKQHENPITHPINFVKTTCHQIANNKKVREAHHKLEIIFDLFERVIWEFVNQSAKVIKNSVGIVVKTCPKYTARLGSAIKAIGLLSGINLLLSLKSMPGNLQNWKKNKDLGDLEGTVTASLGLLASLADMLDDTITFTNVLAFIGIFPTIAFFGMIGLPLSMGLLTYGIATKSYYTFRHAQFMHALPKEINSENMEEFKKFLSEKLDDPMDRLKAKKINVLNRRADPKVVNIMKNLQKTLNADAADLNKANEALKDIKTLMGRKITLGCVSVLMNTTMLTTIVAAAAFPAAAVGLPFVAIAKALVSIGSHGYKSFCFTKGLNHPEFAKAS